MPVRSSFVAVAVVVVTLFVVGCAQTASPTSPSSSAPSLSPSSPSSYASLSVSGSTSSVQSTNTGPLLAQSPCSAQSTSTVAPLLAKLNLVDNLLVSANHQLYLGLFPPSESSRIDANRFRAAGNSYEIANPVLDCVALNYPHDALTPGTDVLALIIEQANITLDLLSKLPPSPPPPPSIPQIIKEAEHTILVATTLINCQKDPCFP